MVTFFVKGDTVFAVDSDHSFNSDENGRLTWLFSGATANATPSLSGTFVGPRKEMITPWSTNAVEITQNMGLNGISRIEELRRADSDTPDYDPMLQAVYKNPGADMFASDAKPAPAEEIDDITEYNQREGLAPSGVFSYAEVKTGDNGTYISTGNELLGNKTKVVCVPDDPALEADSVIIDVKYTGKKNKNNPWDIGQANATVDFTLKKKESGQ